MNFAAFLARNVERGPDDVVVIFEERRITNLELSRRVNALAHGLAGLGVGRGSVVSLLLYNCPEFLEIVLAINKLGAIWLPLNFRLAADEFAYILDHGTAEVLFTEPAFHDTIQGIRGRLPLLHTVISLGSPTAGDLAYAELLAAHAGPEVPDAEMGPDDLQRQPGLPGR